MIEPVRHDESEMGSGTLGRYRLLSTLGQGGMGTIHLAESGGLGAFRKLVVLKELRRDLAESERFTEMFLVEARLAARLNHPNVVQTLEAGRDGDRQFLAMEFLDGQPLSKLSKRARTDVRFPLAMSLHVLGEVLAGLHYAHELCDYDGSALEIVHRDVSPQNVFVTYDGQVKVVDFGIAKAAGVDGMTNPGVFKGKLGYAAPEQVRGQASDRRADVFAVGVMLWEALARRRFAPGTPTRAAVEARLQGFEPRISALLPDVDPALAAICDRAMSVNPDGRYATAEEMRVAIAACVGASDGVVDGRAIARSVRAMFFTERATMHRLIDTHSKNEDLAESMVRPLPLVNELVSNDDPTQVADLSQLIESSRPGFGVTTFEPAPEFRPARKPWLFGGVAVVAVGVAAFALGSARTPEPEVTREVSSLIAASAATPAAALAPLASAATVPTSDAGSSPATQRDPAIRENDGRNDQTG